MSLKLRMALIIGFTVIVCVPGMYLLINNHPETSSDEVRKGVSMRANSQRRREQPESKYWWNLKKQLSFIPNSMYKLSIFDSLSLKNFQISNSIKGPSSSRHLLSIIDEPTTSDSTTSSSLGLPTRPAQLFNFPTNPFIFYGNKSARMALHGLIACYIFWMLAIICDEYFVPSIEILCQSEWTFFLRCLNIFFFL